MYTVSLNVAFRWCDQTWPFRSCRTPQASTIYPQTKPSRVLSRTLALSPSEPPQHFQNQKSPLSARSGSGLQPLSAWGLRKFTFISSICYCCEWNNELINIKVGLDFCLDVSFLTLIEFFKFIYKLYLFIKYLFIHAFI